VCRWILFLAAVAAQADDTGLLLALKAQTDFDRVELEPVARVQDTMRCVQSQAQVLPVTRPAELPLIHYRKGYCELLNGDNRAAAGDFAKALADWPTRAPEPVSAGLQVLSAVARLRAGADPAELGGIRAGLEEAENKSVCLANVMPAARCRDLVQLGRLWLGWMDLRQGNLDAASQRFAAFPQTAWHSWTAARQAMDQHRYDEAVASLRKAVEIWHNEETSPPAGIVRVLGPSAQRPDAVFLLGQAEYLAREYKSALSDFGAALKADPGNAQALYLRGRTREALGEAEGAITDYQLASRLAFANPDRPDSTALAHYYRGVWWLRRKSFSQAEDEFSAALNNTGNPALRADLTAWRYLAAVAGGSCQTAAARLESALAAASDLFPKQEARQSIQACRPAI
jgi:tetratricopeptide (TPR) repeat protein